MEPVNSVKEPLRCFTAESYMAQYLANWSCSLFCNKLIRAAAVGEIRFRGERRRIDDEFFTYKVASRAGKILRIHDVLYHYRQRASSTVKNSQHQLQITDDALEVLVERYEWIASRFPGLRKTYLSHDIDILFYIAGFPHDQKTAAKFHKIKRYYLKEALFHCFEPKQLANVFKLQRISTKMLLDNPLKTRDTPSDKQYFA